MKLNFDAPILDLDGKTPMKGQGDKNATLGSIAVQALIATYADEQPTAEEKVRRGILAENAYSGGEQELTVEDAALLKLLIGKGYGPLVVRRAFQIIEKAG